MSQFETCLFSHGRSFGRWALTTRKFPTAVQFNLLFLEFAFFLATFCEKYALTTWTLTLICTEKVAPVSILLHGLISLFSTHIGVIIGKYIMFSPIHYFETKSLSAFPMWLEFDFLKWKLAAAGSSLLWGNGRPLSKNFDTKS